jgi:hypothetical protein
MPSFTRAVLTGIISLILLKTSSVSAEPTIQQARIALVEKPWALALDITGYHIQVDGIKPDGRRYFFATNASTSMSLSVTLEAVPGPATEQGCFIHLDKITHLSPAGTTPKTVRYQIRHMPVVEQTITEDRKDKAHQLHLFACVGKENVYADIHVSKVDYKAGDDTLLRQVVNSIEIVPAAAANSLDHFRAGSAPYLQGRYAQAIPHYQQALALEQATQRLDKPLWRLLIKNLGVAYGKTGDLARSRTTFVYGLSQDPDNPQFHYNLARIFAQMNDRDGAMQSLDAAFRSHQGRNLDEPIPDPRQDVSFRRFMLDPAVRTLAESLMRPAI